MTEHEPLALYVLDALEPEEGRRFEEHLAVCEECRGELDSLRAAAASLAWAVETPAPPPALRETILARARRETQDNVVALGPRRRLRSWRAFAAVAAAAAVVLGIWAASLHRSLGGERSARERLVALLAQADAQRIPLQGAEGTLVVAPASREAALVFDRLAAPGEGKVYEAWVVQGNRLQPAGTFEGTRILLSRRVPPGATVAVTREGRNDVDVMSPPVLFQARAT